MFARLLIAILVVSSPIARADDDGRAAKPVDFVADVQPLLTKHCEGCHGADERESGFRIDFASELLKGGDTGSAVVPGKPEKSLLYTVLLGDGDVARMPYEEDPLSAKEIALVRRWIADGAKIPEAELAKRPDTTSDHWAFQPIERVEPPRVPDEANVHNAVDRFILARLAKEGLPPSLKADRATLIRRVTLDLTGLLPSPDEVTAFVDDRHPDAYERLVDRLLASPHYGERWGRHWLDLARYADSNGFTIDGPRSIWPYRDWVIEAINANQPYDRFVIEQLAGDLLPQPSREQLVATGFHRNTLVNQEGGTDPEQFRVEAVVDRVSTTGAVFLGLTVGCAQCHSHKYDPLSQREFYELYAFFNHTEDVKSVAPTLPLPSPAQAKRQAELKTLIAAAEAKLKTHDAGVIAGREEWEANAAKQPETNWTVRAPVVMKSAGGARMNPLDDGSVFVGGDGNLPENDTYTVTLAPPSGTITAIRLETPTYDNLPNGGPGWASNGNFVLTAFELALVGPGEAKPQPIKLKTAIADWSQDGYPIEYTIDGNPKSGWAINVKAGQGSPNVGREAVFVPEKPITIADGGRLLVTLKHEINEKYLVGRFRLSTTTDELGETIVLPNVRAALVAKKRSPGQNAVVAAAYGGSDLARKPLADAVNRLKKESSDLARSVPTTMILRERRQPRETHVMIRGDFLRHGARVAPSVPAVLPPLSEHVDDPNRLDFANWLFQPEHPLTARVTVNRYWQRFFGRGLVETENDFGTQGTPPSHPALLDWLASEFIRTGWDVKRLHRLIVTSATYRQSSFVRADHLERDQANKWLARQSRVRLQAESIRDACLSASGLLTSEFGGPGVYPPQPAGLRLLSQNGKPWPESKGPDRYRRGLYTFFWRSNPYPFLLTFDAPRANTTCTRRVRSNTPLQSLTLANDRTFVEFAQGLAQRVLTDGPTEDAARIARAVELCLSREPTPFESRTLLAFLKRQRQYFDSHGAEAEAIAPNIENVPTTESAAWTAVARVLLNLDEFITRE